MNYQTISLLLHLSALLLIIGCKPQGSKQQESTPQDTTPTAMTTPFSPDSAYYYIDQQVAFGPRVPNTDEHRACAAWLTGTLQRHGAEVIEQRFSTKAHDGTELHLTNIIGSYNPSAVRRVLLMAHWDTRPWADKEGNPSLHSKPILGADDAGSGVGVLLEIARLLGSTSPIEHLGVDIILFDGEDYGDYGDEASWCLGSSYWSLHPHKVGYQADRGILLDMVGAKDATFYWEVLSKTYAHQLLSQVWDKAARMGYSHYFRQAEGGAITDDHLPVIRNLGIPCIDILNYNPTIDNGFAPYWHTLRDDMTNISTETLGAVGHTLVALLQEWDQAAQ